MDVVLGQEDVRQARDGAGFVPGEPPAPGEGPRCVYRPPHSEEVMEGGGSRRVRQFSGFGGGPGVLPEDRRPDGLAVAVEQHESWCLT